MADEPTTPVEAPEGATTLPEPVEDTVPASRFNEVKKHKQAADAELKTLRKELADLKASLEDRESAGLPELERERKARERLEKQLADAQTAIEQSQQQQARAQKERLVLAAAARAKFDEADDALRYPEFVNLDEIETPEDADRAIKRLAKAKPKLLAAEDPKLPGQVLRDGRAPAPTSSQLPGTTRPGAATGLVDKQQEAEAVGEALQSFLKTRKASSITFDSGF